MRAYVLLKLLNELGGKFGRWVEQFICLFVFAMSIMHSITHEHICKILFFI